MNPPVFAIPESAFRIARISSSDSGSRCRTITFPPRDTLLRWSLSLAPSQSASRHDSRNRGLPKPWSFARIASNGVRPSVVPRPRFVQPIDIERGVAPLRSIVEDQEVARGHIECTLTSRFMLERLRLTGTGCAKQHIGVRLPKFLQRPGGTSGLVAIIPARRLRCTCVGRGRSQVFEPFSGRGRQKLRQRDSFLPDKDGARDIEALSEYLEAAHIRPARAALDFEGKDFSATLQNEIHLAAVLAPVMQAMLGHPRV